MTSLPPMPPARPAGFFVHGAYLAFLLLFGVATFAYNAVAFVLCLGPVSEKQQRQARAVIGWFFRSYVRSLEATGRFACEWVSAGPPPASRRGTLIVANHPSMIDAPLLGARLPEVICYFKASMHSSICGASGARLAGYLRNDAGIEGIRAAVSHLRAGGNVILFPEGTRTAGAELGQLHPGFGLIAAQAGCPVLCLRIETNSNLLGKHHTFWRAPTVPACFRITELGTLHAESGERPLAFAARVEACLKGEPAPSAQVAEAWPVASTTDG